MNLSDKDISLEALLPENSSNFCRSKIFYIIAGLALICSVCVGAVTYYFLNDQKTSFFLNTPETIPSNDFCSIKDTDRFDCFPDAPVTESECKQRGCCYNPTPDENKDLSFPPLGTPYCYYPTNYVGYKIDNISWDDDHYEATLSKVTASGFPKDVKNLLLVVTFIDNISVRIKITDPKSERFEVPIPLNADIQPKSNHLYGVNLTMDGTLSIYRWSTNTPVFRTNLFNLVYSDQFLQISSSLTSPYFYGLGEHKSGILRSVNWTRFTMFNRDREPIPNKNLYGTQPFYIALEKDGNANGVFLYNSNAMDVILQPTPAVTFRTIGGVLDLFVLLGPTPRDVVQQYTNIVGRTFMPPYWSLGFHLCKYGYGSLNNTKAVWQRMRDAGIPYDVQWNDIDYMEKNMDFTYDKVNYQGLPEFVNELHQVGMHYVVMIDPGVSNSEKPGTYPPYDEGVEKDLFIKNTSGHYFEAKVWNTGHTVFPDFSNPTSVGYWKDQFERFYSEVKVDGIWIDMNEPSNMYNGQENGCPNSTFEDPPYLPGGDEPLRTVTVCMTAQHFSTIHYNEHNLISYREAKTTNIALRDIRPNKRPFIISRATFTGQGMHSGHWSGDIYSSWEDMRYTIPSLLNFNIYGMSMIGSDICGFNGNTTEELCARWQSLGAFYPFSRNHNDKASLPQDPAILGPVVVEATKKSLSARYYLLPYLYTLFFRSHVFGETVARPLFFEYISDINTFGIDEQFLWGPALMIIPVLYPNVTEISAYFPKGEWYNFHSGENKKSAGQEFKITIPLTDIDLEVRGGYIIPLQTPATTTTESRKNKFDIFVALDENKEASGELYWDDGDTLDAYENENYNQIEFSAKLNTLNSTVLKGLYLTNMDIGDIKVYGIDKSPTQVTINSNATSFVYNKTCLFIHTEGYTLLTNLTVVWS